MSWQTTTTPIVKGADGFEAKPPDDSHGWEPIGVHAEHVVWRLRMFGANDVKTREAMVEVLDALLKAGAREQADLICARRAERLAIAARMRELLDARREFKAELQRAKALAYSRGYEAGRKKRGQPGQAQAP